MSIGSEPVDDNARPIQGWDSANHRPAVPQISSTSVDADGVVYGNMSISGSVTAPAAAGYVALTSPPTQTNVGSDTPLTFSQQVNQIVLQNNTSANVYYAFDTAATLGSLVLAPGYMLVYPKKVTVVHLYTVAAQNINGTAVGGIVAIGEL